MQSVVLFDGDSTTAWASEASNLDTFYSTKNIATPVFRIQERNLAFVTLVIKIVVHSRTFRLVKKKTV